MTETISYSTPAPAKPLKPAWRCYWLRVPMVCWIVPLVAGLVVVCGVEVVRPPGSHLHDFLFTKTHLGSPVLYRWVDYGLLTLLIGSTLAFYGVISIITFAMLRWSAATDRWRQVVRPALVMLALILSNFAVAAGLITIEFR